MAGIGFELKRLFKRKGLFATMRAYGYAGIVCTGPMLLGVLLQVRTAERDALALSSGHLRRESLFNIGGEKATIAFIMNGLFLRATINVDISLEEGMIWVR